MKKCIAFVDDDERICRYLREYAIYRGYECFCYHEAETAYTNRGDKAVASASWSLPNHTPSSGTGTSMAFTVAADDTLTWNTSLTTASSELLVNDTFEEYAPDTTTESGVLSGWTGEAWSSRRPMRRRRSGIRSGGRRTRRSCPSRTVKWNVPTMSLR